MKLSRLLSVLIFLIIFSSHQQALIAARGASAMDAAAQGEQPVDWKSEWAVEEGLAVSIDTEGYQLPSAIAFVPHPGPGPKDPLYYVAELRGKVKVITNDRTQYTFAQGFFTSNPDHELPDIEGETGMAGICLDPSHGYIFVTFAYLDSQHILRNNIFRFQTQPGTFAVKPSAQMDFKDIFAAYDVVPSHQIGSCQVSGDHLYVSVADGRKTEQSQRTDSLLGKILRMTLDGKPLPDNPFYKDDSIDQAQNFIWAYGFRNPFGLRVIGEQVFVADNGHNVDRFVQVDKGRNYLWDGSDYSIGTNANIAISPAVGPVRIEYYPGGSDAIPEKYAQDFFIASSAPKYAGILAFSYNQEEKRALNVPRFIVQHRGEGYQSVVGLGIGPDGIYFLPLMPDAQGKSYVLKLSKDSQGSYPTLLLSDQDPDELMRSKGCYGCHTLNGEGGSAGPALDRQPLIEHLQARLNSDEYLQLLAEVDRLDQEPYRSYKNARAEVRSAQNQERIRIWMKYHIVEPKFDNPSAQMPNLGLTQGEALLISDYLLGQDKSWISRAYDRILGFFPQPLLPRHIAFSFIGGFGAGVLFLALFSILFSKIKREQSRRKVGREEFAASPAAPRGRDL